jgi:hypothetical protein
VVLERAVWLEVRHKQDMLQRYTGNRFMNRLELKKEGKISIKDGDI